MINGTRYRLSVEINRQSQLARDIARLQTQVTTGKRIDAPSDDPTAAARISEIARTQADQAIYSRNLGHAAALAQRADTALEGVTIAVDRARELMLTASSGTRSDDERRIIAAELRGLADQITAISNSVDNRGAPLVPAGDPLEIPVAEGITVTAVASRAGLFDEVPTAGGPQSFVQLLNDAAAALEEPDLALRQAATDESLAELGAAVEHVAAIAGEQGVRATRIEAMQDRALESKLQLEEERSELESTDLTVAIATLQSKQLTLEAAQAVFARINQTSLFDLLR